MKSLWLVKSEELSSKLYQEKLSTLGIDVYHIPSLTFKFFADRLQDSIKNVNQHSGIIFTSIRAVEVCSNCFLKLPMNIHNEWQKKKIFAIGPTTANAVREKLKLNPVGVEAANGQQLGEIIVRETIAFDKPLLFPCGNLKKDCLPMILASNDRDFRAITCYETREHPELHSTLSKLDNKPDFIVFFSPSGVNFTVPILKNLSFDWVGVKVIALGPTTNVSLVQNNILVYGICSEPNPQSLLNLIIGSL